MTASFFRQLACIAALTGGFTPSWAGIETPRVGSEAHTSIMRLHKDSARADIHIEPYRISAIRLARTATLDIAYVRAASRSSQASYLAFEEVIVRRKGQSWQRIWADGSGGSNDCAAGIAHYERIIRFAQHHGANPRQLLPGFGQRLTQAKRGDCDFGDFDADETWLKPSARVHPRKP
jgi:hypothetical protein